MLTSFPGAAVLRASKARAEKPSGAISRRGPGHALGAIALAAALGLPGTALNAESSGGMVGIASAVPAQTPLQTPAQTPMVTSSNARPAGLGVDTGAAVAQLAGFRQALAGDVAGDKTLAAFYQSRDFRPLWTGPGDAARRRAFFDALADASEQGLPAARYDAAGLVAGLRAVRTEGERAAIEARLSQTFLSYAKDIQTGVLTPGAVSPGLVLSVPLRDPLQVMTAFAASDPAGFLRSLPPQMPQYRQLLKAKLDMERLIAEGGWGPTVPGKKLRPGDSGPGVIALRNRMIAMGYMRRSAVASYDGTLQAAVQRFQLDHGLDPDGVAGGDTLRQINESATDRLKSIMVAMERLRWLNMPWGKRYVWVNEADFTARVVDNGKTTFQTRVVVGKNGKDTRSPEFSNTIKFLVVNPVWNVPRSIATKEYLPKLKRNPNAVSYLNIVNSKGQVVDRSSIDFSQYTEKSFPFAIKQPPSTRNALGLVKFMFPNRWNIYLHDTPSKSLFKRDVRAFSHGCIRLNDPFDLAYVLLGAQSANPKALFKRALDTGRETTIDLATPVPVHLTYFTAWPSAKGGIEYRRDIYGRDARIFDALAKAGVALPSVQG